MSIVLIVLTTFCKNLTAVIIMEQVEETLQHMQGWAQGKRQQRIL